MINPNAKNILIELEKAGYEGYIVGGAVRDLIMGVEPHDWDIATNARPEQVKEIFSKTFDSGIEFGTVTAIVQNEEFEITTYRIDGKYENNRKPNKVNFTSSIIEDLKRRDFTINSMACDKSGIIVDPFGGQDDIQKGIIRAVGNPTERIGEDALRMLRAIRFSARYGFKIDESLYEAIKQNSYLIQNISYERIEAEITKIITSAHPEKFLDLYYTGITKHILPEFDAEMDCEQNTIWHKHNVGIHTIETMKNIEDTKILRWTMLLHDIAKPKCKVTDERGDHFWGHPEEGAKMVPGVLKRFKMPREEIKKIETLVLYHDMHLKKEKKIRMFAAKYGREVADSLYKIQMADIAGQSDYKLSEKIEDVTIMNKSLNEAIDNGTAITLRELAINGNDLLELGFKGKEVGNILWNLYELAICDLNINNREFLIDYVKNNYLNQEIR